MPSLEKQSQKEMKTRGRNEFPAFVAVHGGAGLGTTSHQNSNSRLETCRGAVSAGLKELLNDPTAGIVPCVAAIKTLEDSPKTNAGVGSNLTSVGGVECDAGLMDSRSACAAGVGAVSGVPNPIQIAEKLLRDQLSHSSALIPPSVLVGDGARDFAKEAGIPVTHPDTLCTAGSRKAFERGRERVWVAERLDTVGAVCLCSDGSVAAGSSSGGLLLKRPGRLGSAALAGAGFWTEERDDVAVAVSASGCGEYLISTDFSRNLARTLLSASEETPLALTLDSWFRNEFVKWNSRRNFPHKHRLAGAIILRVDKRTRESEFAWIHNTPNLCVGYGASGFSPRATFSQLSSDSSFLISGVPVVSQ